MVERSPTRPPVTVVLPFHGSSSEAGAALERLGSLRLRAGDAALLVDNSDPQAVSSHAAPPQVTVVPAPVKRSAYAARNIGVERARTEWVAFIDADCRPSPDLLDRYFSPLPREGAGAVAGAVTGTPRQPGVVPAYARSRGHLDQARLAHHPYRPMAVTANLLVRRTAWEAVGGFQEHTRSGADADFCWRLLDAGWQLEQRERAGVTHDHRPSLAALLAQSRRDGAGGRWLSRRHAGYRPAFTAAHFLRAACGAVAWPPLGQPRRGLFKLIDGIWGAAFDVGMLESNAPPLLAGPQPELIVLLEEFPRPADPLVAALAREAAAGRPLRVEARRRPSRAGWSEARSIPVNLWEDDAPLARLGAAARTFAAPRRRVPAELGPASVRLRRAAPNAVVLVEPGLEEDAGVLARAAGRRDLRFQLADHRAVGVFPPAALPA